MEIPNIINMFIIGISGDEITMVYFISNVHKFESINYVIMY